MSNTVEKLKEFKNLEDHYGTFTCGDIRDISGKKIGIECRSGFQTDIGDIEENDWYSRVLSLIKKYNEEEILYKLKEFVSDDVWLNTDEKALHYALRLHIGRIFEDPEWVCYEEFKKILQKPATTSENFSNKIEEIKEELKIINNKSDKFNIELDDILK